MLFFEKSKLSYAIGRHESPTPSLNIINFSVYTSAISLSFVSELKFSCCTILIIMYDLVKIVSIVLEKSCWPTSSRIFSILLPLKQWAAEIAAAEDTGKIFNNNLREALWIDYTYSCSANNTLLTVGESSHWRILIGSGLVPTNNFSSVLLSTWTSINNSSDAAMKGLPIGIKPVLKPTDIRVLNDSFDIGPNWPQYVSPSAKSFLPRFEIVILFEHPIS